MAKGIGQHDAAFERALVNAAWREWQENTSRRSELIFADGSRPPGWFVGIELGFRWGEAPSLMWTSENLARQNRAALAMLGHQAPLRVSYPKDFSRDPRRPRSAPRARGRRDDDGESLALLVERVMATRME